MAEYLEHVTKEGERWDQLAFLYYGDALAFERIMAANPEMPLTSTLPGGVAILIPVVDSNTTSLQDLPPWNR